MYWGKILELAGYQSRVSPTMADPRPSDRLTLPVRIPCPFCKDDRLYVYHSQYTSGVPSGQWYYCAGCKLRGDVLELAAKLWGTDASSTVKQLVKHGVPFRPSPEVAVADLENGQKIRKEIDSLWELAQSRPFHENERLNRIAHRWRWDYFQHADYWRNGPGQILGWLTGEEIKSWLARVGGQRFYRTSKVWPEAFVIPHHSLPGQVRSFLFISSRGNDEDFIFVDAATGRKLLGVQGGIVLHPDLTEHVMHSSNPVHVLNDVRVGVHLMSRHASGSPTPLPITMYHQQDMDSVPAPLWPVLDGRSKLICAEKISREMLAHAISSDADICICNPDRSSTHYSSSVDQMLDSRLSPNHQLLTMITKTKPWPDMLSTHIAGMQEATVDGLFDYFRRMGLDTSAVCNRLHTKQRHIVRKILSTGQAGRTITFQQRTVVEREGCWYVESKRGKGYELICGGRVIVDSIVRQSKIGHTYFQGRLIYRDREFPFFERREKLLRNAGTFLQDLAGEAGGQALFVARTWSTSLMDIAQLLQPPTYVTSVDRIGWSDHYSAFIFPKFRIDNGGEIYLNTQTHFPSDLPCLDVTVPKTLSGQDINKLFADTSLKIALTAIVGTIVSNILAPVFHRPTRGIAVSGVAVEELAKIVSLAIGCRQIIPQKSKSGELKLIDIENEHGWPIYVDYPVADSHRIAGWVDPERMCHKQHNCIVSLNWYLSTLQKLSTEWHVISGNKPLTMPNKDGLEVLGRLVPCYLKDLCQRGLQLMPIRDGGDWFDCVFNDFARFLAKHGLNNMPKYQIAEQAREMVTAASDGGHADAFAELVAELIYSNHLEVVDSGQIPVDEPLYQAAAVRVRSENIVAIPKRRFLSAMRTRQAPVPSCANISAVLATAGRLVEDGAGYWVVESEWLDHKSLVLDVQRTGRLKIRQEEA